MTSPLGNTEGWAEEKAEEIQARVVECCFRDGDTRNADAYWELGCKAALLEADRRGCERGRKQFISSLTSEELLAEIESRLPDQWPPTSDAEGTGK